MLPADSVSLSLLSGPSAFMGEMKKQTQGGAGGHKTLASREEGPAGWDREDEDSVGVK